jgi:hypothetical protein
MLTVLSMLLCVVALALWPHSYRSATIVQRLWPERNVLLVSVKGHVSLHEQVAPVFPTTEWNFRFSPKFDERCVRHPVVWSAGGLSMERYDGTGDFIGSYDRSLVIPYWLPALVCLTLPMVRAASAIRYQRRRASLPACSTCGYDLTANVSGVCPECGTGIATPP